MSAALLLAMLLMGLTGSLHCAGMCGPIVWVMPFQQYTGHRRGLGIALYHLGRISVYALLGIILHLFKGLFHPQWQQYFSIGAGMLLLVIGCLSFMPQARMQVKLPWTSMVAKGLAGVMRQRHPFWLAAAGALNGLLPCGMVYMALAAAVIVNHTWQAAVMMYAFGLGTAPMMVAITVLRTKAPLRVVSLKKWTPLVMFLFGCLFVLRGANLGIPLLSPKAVTTQSHKINLECCRKAH